MLFNIVLVEPEIPANTGNIARTCSVTGCSLHLVKPLGFSIEDKYLKRAGLDYWNTLDINLYNNLDDFLAKTNPALLYYATTKAKRGFTEIAYPTGAYFVFGKETKGLPEMLLRKEQERCIRVPMGFQARSLNLSNTVAIVVYEAFRQHGFQGLS
ncbi:MAG: tRNA (uridine(34)/cytosine(34)/5-carboxymethylaminomethyluridine(34)-2'-O)-methyltransferase TrmL [Firmicutes bacterium HGW-Firmicutes-12]|nr:MAG: tRNA (uridine(34)/cytosine(34)/5-carboxymethylaminomethyluridine(34)-2'-O)-methyltransferase TrmL [Firmicutes bacterium HGW-Firmicutes-12]